MLRLMLHCLLRAWKRKLKVPPEENTVDKLSCLFCGFYTGGRNFFDFITAMRRPPFQIDFTTVQSTTQCSEAPTFSFGADTSILNGLRDLYHYPARLDEPIVA